MGHPHREVEYVEMPPDPPQGLGLPEKRKPLKHARSQAELTRVSQGKALIFLNCLNVTLTALVVLKTFGII